MVPPARAAVVWPWLLCLTFFPIVAADGCAAGFGTSGGFPWDGGSSGSSDAPPPPTGDSSACRPGDVETFQPAPYHPATAAWQGVCSPDAIAGFYDACIGPQRTSAACDAFTSDKTTGPCAACILPPDGASHDGPLINHGTFITANVAGCLELTDRSILPCARVVAALGGCELAACQANCPVHDSASLEAFDTCAGQADHAGCKSYAIAAACISAGDAGQSAMCLIPSFPDLYNAVAPLFCGAPPPGLDGGVLPEFDSSTDAGAGTVDATMDAPADARVDVRSDAPRDAPAESRADGSADAAME
jgi:hypothetical protein